jgi:hypothetical protein
MPLILAIEPDRKQASQLTAVVRGRLHAELVLAESAERALAALGDRIPDLILTSPLLSPRDENELGERLRALDGAANHVHTLTTPVLASPNKHSLAGNAVGGVLSALRREKSAPAAHNGCDPAVFAEQCREYLERAAAERAAQLEQAAVAAENGARTLAAPRVAAPPPPPPEPRGVSPLFVKRQRTPPPVKEPVAIPPADESAAIGSVTAPREPIEFASGDEVRAESPEIASYTTAHSGITSLGLTPSYTAPARTGRDTFADDTPISEASRLLDSLGREPDHSSHRFADDRDTTAADSSPATEPLRAHAADDEEGPASLLAAVAALAAEEAMLVEAAAAPVAPAVTAGEPLPDPFSDFDLSALLEEPGAAAARAHRAHDDADDAVAIYELDPNSLSEFEPEMAPPSIAALEPAAALAAVEPPPAAVIEPEPPDDAPDESVPAAPALAAGADQSTAAQAADQREPDQTKGWLDIIEALRRDAQSPFANPAPATPAADPLAEAVAKSARSNPNGSPKQDEWGFFDPEQCGFQALLAKLEETTDKEDSPKPGA